MISGQHWLTYSLVIIGFVTLIGRVGKGQSQPASNSGALVESHVRGGLPNFFHKIQSGQEVRIAYIGGSITEARDGWRDLTFNWFRVTYPHTPFRQIDATIGGTGSDLGVFRMDRDVLSQQPDLVFVEFAVNDYGRTVESIRLSIEGIVRKTWKQYPSADICFVYTIAENVVETLRKGTYQHSALAMEQIADRYQIPSVHLGVEVVRLLESGKLIFTGEPEKHPDKVVFTRDRTHPLTASGHPIYAHSVVQFMQKLEPVNAASPHSLSAPVDAHNWEQAQMIPLTALKRTGKWEELPASDERRQRFSQFMPTLYRADPPNGSLTVTFVGNVLGFYDVVGPQSGIVEVIVDQQAPTHVYRFDQWCNSYRKSTFFVPNLSDGRHQVTIRVSDKAFDKAEILKKRSITMTNPNDYVGTSWFPASVLLVGKLHND